METVYTQKCETCPVIKVLQEARSKELYAISQYLSHHEQLESMGYSKLADEMKDIAIVEMDHAGTLASRIKQLGCEPIDCSDTEIYKQEAVHDIMLFDAEVEKKAISEYNEFLKLCFDHKDAISAGIFAELINDEQEHFDYFNKVTGLIGDLGHSYLATQANARVSSIKRKY